MEKDLLDQVENLFMELGFSKINLNDRTTYLKEEKYIRIDYIKTFNSIVFEYANGIEEAQNNVFEDGDLYPIKIGHKLILREMKTDLIKILQAKESNKY